jgi:hypothetical protein
MIKFLEDALDFTLVLAVGTIVLSIIGFIIVNIVL